MEVRAALNEAGLKRNSKRRGGRGEVIRSVDDQRNAGTMRLRTSGTGHRDGIGAGRSSGAAFARNGVRCRVSAPQNRGKKRHSWYRKRPANLPLHLQ